MWVARDKYGSLWICNTKPIRTSGYWDYDDFDGILEIKDESLFPELTWEDEPIEVVLEVVPQPIKPDEYFDEGDMIELESMGIGHRVDGGFVYN